MTKDTIKGYCPLCGKHVTIFTGALEIKPRRGKKFFVHPKCYEELPKHPRK